MTTPTQPHLQPSPEQEKRLALRLLELGPRRSCDPIEWNNVAQDMCKFCRGSEDVTEAALRILAADFAKEKAELEGKVKHEKRISHDARQMEAEATNKMLAAESDLSTLRSENAELEKRLSILPGLTESLNEISRERLALAAALKQAREAISEELLQRKRELINWETTRDRVQKIDDQDIRESILALDAALAAPADLGMVERIRGVLAQSYQYLHNGIGGAGLLANIKQLLTDLGGPVSQ